MELSALPAESTLSARALRLLALLTAFAACTAVAWALLVPGPLDWQVSTPQYIQGGLEALLLMGGLALLQQLPRRGWRLGLGGVLALLYLRRHGVDAPALLALLHVEFTLALGAAVCRLAGAALPRSVEDYLRCFVLGLGLWSVAAWTLSALGPGTALALRYLWLMLLPLALWARARPLLAHLFARSEGWQPLDRGLFGLLCGWMLVLFARTNVVYSFDGLWYGYRPEEVLVAGGSVFAPLGLVSPVYYFPKLYEVYLLPLSDLGDTSPQAGVTILLLGLLALTAARLARRFGAASPRAQLLLGALLLSLPALANAALEPKPDIVCALLVLLAWLHGGNWLQQQRGHSELAWAVAAGLLAVSSKLVAVPYLGMLGVGLLLGLFWRRRYAALAPPAPARLGWIALALAAVAAVFVMARTQLLAGMPTIGPDPLFKVWTMLGFELREPAGTLTWTRPQDWSQVPLLLRDWLLRPDQMDHIAISWPGNVWLWLPLCALLLGRYGPAAPAAVPAHRSAGLLLMLAGVVLALGWQYHSRGSDGNYFIAAIVPATVLGFALAWRRTTAAAAARGTLFAGVLLFAGFQAAYSFASAAWTPGTRTFDLDFSRGVRDSRKRETALLADAGLTGIADYLRTRKPAHVLGCAPFDVTTALPARVEDPFGISLSRPEYTRDFAALTDYMRRFETPYLLLPRRDVEKPYLPAPGDPCGNIPDHPPGTETLVEGPRFRLLRLIPLATP
ncbi:hypothetical protein [Tahibacter harae]|uniref:Dolichyl-phosphate-mannose-protein mannosyltransferase n=1 Tax=Tahibacter harae TaxID=2963937 RepID=A0ABT1QR94_9GAMM|nr:hypothetical protein [Tahibacter harae]MCQ4164781.1 hypothetical protein [Tahibacter harae]